MPTRLVASLNTGIQRLAQGRPLVVVVCAASLALFGGGAATGWILADRFSPRSAPDAQITVAPAGGSDVEGVTMPDVRGMDVATARQVLVDVGLGGVEVTEREQPWVGAAGRVVGQEPVGGAAAPSQVTLFVSAAATVPNLVGTDVTEAQRVLQLLGAEVVVHRVYRPGVPADQTLDVAPPPGSPVPARVELTVSTSASTLDLTELEAVSSNGCSRSTDLIVNGTKFPTGLTCRGGKDFATIVYLLGGHTAEFTAVVGQPDTAEPGSRMLVEILTDGKIASSRGIGFGEAAAVTINTAGVLRLELRARLDPAPIGSTRGTAVFAGVQVVGGGAELLAVKALTS